LRYAKKTIDGAPFDEKSNQPKSEILGYENAPIVISNSKATKKPSKLCKTMNNGFVIYPTNRR
jgi:hypothetical protein